MYDSRMHDNVILSILKCHFLKNINHSEMIKTFKHQIITTSQHVQHQQINILLDDRQDGEISLAAEP